MTAADQVVIDREELEGLRAKAAANGEQIRGLVFGNELERPIIAGRIPEAEREAWLKLFETDPHAAFLGVFYLWRPA